MNTLELISALRNTGGRTDKEQLLMNAFTAGNREFFEGFKMAYDPTVTYGVKKIALIDEIDSEIGMDDTDNLSFSDFKKLANALETRELTGNNAKKAINEAAEQCNIDKWNNFYRRILLKNFAIGCDVKTINKILLKLAPIYDDAHNYIVTVFSLQLAMDGIKYPKKMSGIKLLDVKMDGVRLLSILDKEKKIVTQFTRNGKINTNFPHLRESLEKLIPLIPASIVLDGEVVDNSFNELMTQLNRKTDVDTSATKLALFDIIPLNRFSEGECKTPLKNRHDVLVDMIPMFQEHCGESVQVLPKVLVNLDTEEGKAAFAEFNKRALINGFEGVMAKDANSPYRTKKTPDWLKIKPFIEVTLKVMDVEPGNADGKYFGTTGALVCAGEDDGIYIKTNVSTGLSDALRDEIFADKNKFIGMMVEVKADAISKNSVTGEFSLRFPRFKGWRGTKKGEKI